MAHTLTRTLAALALGATVLAGCGSDDDTATDTGVVSGDGGADAGAAGGSGGEELTWPTEEAYGTGAEGTVTVDGAEYGVDEVRLCDVTDFASDGEEVDWRMQGVGAADPEEEYLRFTELAELAVHTGTGSRDRDLVSFTWNGPEGIYDARQFGDEITIEVGEDRITGTAELRSHLGNPPVEVTVDVAVADGDLEDCS